MKLLEQYNYRAPSSWRPQASLVENSDLGLWGVCFSWGEHNFTEKLFENIQIFLEACHNQSEITNPYGYDESLSALENALRSGCSLANDVLFRMANTQMLMSGLECLFLAQRNQEVALLQVGLPNAFLKRRGQLLPLLVSTDTTALDPSQSAPLPSKFLGINRTCYPHLYSFRYIEGDELILLSHSCCPQALAKPHKEASVAHSLKTLFEEIARELPHCPFWIARLSL